MVFCQKTPFKLINFGDFSYGLLWIFFKNILDLSFLYKNEQIKSTMGIGYDFYLCPSVPVLQRSFKDLRSFEDFCPKIHLRLHLRFIFRCRRIFEASKILGRRLRRFFGKIYQYFGQKLSEKV